MTVPCYHCPDRQAGCHAQCAAYRAFRAELDERNAAARQRAVPCVRQKGGPHGGMRQMRQAFCPAARRSLAQDLPRLPPGTAHKGGARAIFWQYGPKAAGRSRRR